MNRHAQIITEPFFKLAGVSLLLLSFVLTGWMLENAVVAADHLLDVLGHVVQSAAAIFQPHDHTLFAG
jgi:hypothetical protein